MYPTTYGYTANPHSKFRTDIHRIETPPKTYDQLLAEQAERRRRYGHPRVKAFETNKRTLKQIRKIVDANRGATPAMAKIREIIDKNLAKATIRS